MRTARAFIASVPLAIILVAALVVPLAVIPGTFGFDSWPSSHGAAISDRQVRLPAPKVDVVAVRPRNRAPQRHPVFVAARPHAASPVRTAVAVAPHPHPAPLVRVSAPAPKPDPVRHHTVSQPAQPQPHQQQPQTAPPPQPQPQPQPSKNELADGNGPVAREQVPQEPQPQPAPEPAPAPPPVGQPAPAPVERVVPSEPCHGQGGREHGQHGDGNFGD
jgi:hypothetical protein